MLFSSPIVPAIIPINEAQLRVFVERLQRVPELHVDVVDGKFVSAISWPYEPSGVPQACYQALERFSLEVDLMVAEPLTAATAWLLAGADRLVFHVESITVEALATFASTTGVTLGIAANNDTPLLALLPYLPYVDHIQVMGIATIGSQGQPFDERALDRIQALAAYRNTHTIGLDGSVNAQTLPALAALHLDRYIMGSAIIQAEDPLLAYQTFSQVAGVPSTGRA